jgi:pimeloyl-ACP methyl ester carboxylesterase
MQRVDRTTDLLMEVKRKLEWSNVEGLVVEQGPLWTALNRYARKSKPNRGQGVTLVMAHANGFHKETWETTIKHLFAQTEAPGSSVYVEEIWTFDAVQHGDSGLVNTENLSGIFDWRDNARDILNILVNYLPETFELTTLPTHLTRVSDAVAERRRTKGFEGRKIIGVGHSIGGCSTALATHAAPSLFSSIMLADPVIMPARLDRTARLRELVRGAVARRTAWASREEAKKLFSNSPFFAAWHPDVLEDYVQHGLYESPSGMVELKTPGLQEANAFTELRTPIEAWEKIEQIDEKIPIRWVVSGKENKLFGGDEMTAELVWRRPQNSSNIRIPNAGHLIAQEAPKELAEEIYRFLNFTHDTVLRPRL